MKPFVKALALRSRNRTVHAGIHARKTFLRPVMESGGNSELPPDSGWRRVMIIMPPAVAAFLFAQ